MLKLFGFLASRAGHAPTQPTQVRRGRSGSGGESGYLMLWRIGKVVIAFAQGLALGIWLAWSAGKEDVELSRELYHNCLEEKGKYFLELYECRRELGVHH